MTTLRKYASLALALLCLLPTGALAESGIGWRGGLMASSTPTDAPTETPTEAPTEAPATRPAGIGWSGGLVPLPTEAPTPEPTRGIGWGGGLVPLEKTPAPLAETPEPQRLPAYYPDGLSITVVDPTTAALHWPDAASQIVQINYGVVGQERKMALTSVQEDGKTAYGLAPGVSYEFEAENMENGDIYTGEVAMPQTQNYEKYNYIWNTCNVFYVLDGPESIFERSRRRVSAVDADKLQENLKDGIYALILEIKWDPTPEDKVWTEHWMMRTPSGDCYVRDDINSCQGSWESLTTSYPLDSIFREYLEAGGEWEAGQYTFEIYFDSQLAGKSSLMIQ